MKGGGGSGGANGRLLLHSRCRIAITRVGNGSRERRRSREGGGARKIPFPAFQSCTLPYACVFACDVTMAPGVCLCAHA